jgi:hypothetical protein
LPAPVAAPRRDFVRAQRAEAKDVHQRIAVVGGVEINLAADGRHADAIAVMRDAATTPESRRRLAAAFGLPGRMSPKRSELISEHGPRAHGEDVAHNAADAGGRALERLDRARVIVRFHLERDAPAVADVDDAGVFLAAP